MHALGSRSYGFSQELGEGEGDDSGDSGALEQMAAYVPRLAEMLSVVRHDDPDSTLGWCDDQFEFESGSTSSSRSRAARPKGMTSRQLASRNASSLSSSRGSTSATSAPPTVSTRHEASANRTNDDDALSSLGYCRVS